MTSGPGQSEGARRKTGASRFGGGLVARVLLVLTCACGGGDGGTPPVTPVLEIRTGGRLERGGVITVRVYRDGVVVSPDSVTLTASPASAVSAIGDTTVTLASTGTVTLSAVVEGLESMTAQKAIAVVAPPTIIFEALRNGNRDIYSVALDGVGLTRLTTDTADDLHPTSWGGEIVFVSQRDGNAELYRMTLAGASQTRITTTPTAQEAEPALSHIGGSLVYVRSNASGLPKIVTSNGTTHTELTNAGVASSIEATPSWSATDRFVYLSTKTGLGNLFVYNMLDGSSTPLPVGAAPNVEPAWNASGDAIAFVSDRTGDTEIHMIALPGNTITQLTNRAGVDAQPTWLPDGRLVFVSVEGTTRTLKWLDLAQKQIVHDIPVGTAIPSWPTAAR